MTEGRHVLIVDFPHVPVTVLQQLFVVELVDLLPGGSLLAPLLEQELIDQNHVLVEGVRLIFINELLDATNLSDQEGALILRVSEGQESIDHLGPFLRSKGFRQLIHTVRLGMQKAVDFGFRFDYCLHLLLPFVCERTMFQVVENFVSEAVPEIRFVRSKSTFHEG